MALVNTWRRSRRIWISLFLIANALDAITTFIVLSKAGVIGFEINPVVHYFGWAVAIAVKIVWVALVAWVWFTRWNRKPSYKSYMMILTTVILVVSLFNVGQNWNPKISRQFICTIISTKYGQGLMENQLDINEIELFVSRCTQYGYTH